MFQDSHLVYRELQQERARYQKDMELKSNEMQHLQEDNQVIIVLTSHQDIVFT